MNINLFFSRFVTKRLTLLLVLLSSYSVFSQETTAEEKVDSLLLMLPTELGEERNRVLINILLHAKTFDANKALKYGRLLEKEIRDSPASKRKAKAYCLIGELYDQSGIATDSVKIFCERCLNIAQKTGSRVSESNALYRLGNYYRGQAEFETALDYFFQAIDVEGINDNNKVKSNCLHGIGVIKDFQKKYDEAIEYFQQAIDIGYEIENDDTIFIGLQSLAISKFQKGDTKEGIKDFLKAKKYAPSLMNKIDVLSNLSFAYTMVNKLDSAEYYLIEANDLAYKYGSDRQKTSSLTALMQFHIQQEDWDKAFPVLKQREKLIKERDNKRWLKINAEDHALYYKNKGDYKQALEYQNQFIIYNDSILNEKNQYAIKDLEEKYENEKKQILIEEQEAELKNKKMQRNLFLTIGLLGILFLLHRIRKNKQLEKQRIVINQKEIEKLKKENTIMNLSSMLEGQHAERKRIAQDLHDGIGALLSSAKLQLNTVKSELGKLEEMAVFSNAETLIENAYNEVRRISHDMMPGALVNLGLFAAVEDLANQINESSKLLIKPQWFTDDDDMDEKTKVSLYLIIQEAVTNTVKYAEARNLIIQLSRNNDLYQLTIEDDGIGFDGNDKTKHGLGLKNIDSRVDYLEGEWEIISTAGEGVSMEISIPVNK